MSYTGEEQRDLMSLGGGGHLGSEHTGTLLIGILTERGGPLLLRQLQHFHRSVVVVHHLGLSPLADQLLVSRCQIGRGSLHSSHWVAAGIGMRIASWSFSIRLKG